MAHRIRSPKKDPQRARVYSAEDTFGRRLAYDVGCTKDMALKLMDRVATMYSVPMPKYEHEHDKYSRFGGSFQYELNDDFVINPKIIVNRAHNRPDMRFVLHEFSHYIDLMYFGGSRALAHGATFVGISGWLYNHFDVMPAIGYRAVLKAKKVEFRPFHLCSPAVLKRRGARRTVVRT